MTVGKKKNGEINNQVWNWDTLLKTGQQQPQTYTGKLISTWHTRSFIYALSITPYGKNWGTIIIISIFHIKN